LSLAIQLENVTKRYRTGRSRTIVDLVASSIDDLRGKSTEVHSATRGKIDATIHALKDVSFDVREGAGLGIIGRNGAGKTTLLKLISRVTWPTSGKVRVAGHVVSLIELGAGFHPELTGRENVYLGAGLFGLTRKEIDRQFDAIVAFADIGDHIHDPIKTYSSGMVVRLGFAIATALTPDVLITDEVLAVGDESFQTKCIAWLERYLQGGGTLLLCSHSMHHVQKLCAHALWLDHGKPRMYGDAGTVAREYLAFHEAKLAKHLDQRQVVGGEYLVKGLALTPRGGGSEVEPDAGFDVSVTIHSPDGRAPGLLIGIVRADGTKVYGTTSEIAGVAPKRLADGRFKFDLHFMSLPLLPGHYRLRAHAMDPEGMRVFDVHEAPFVIGGTSREIGVCRVPHRWMPSPD